MTQQKKQIQKLGRANMFKLMKWIESHWSEILTQTPTYGDAGKAAEKDLGISIPTGSVAGCVKDLGLTWPTRGERSRNGGSEREAIVALAQGVKFLYEIMEYECPPDVLRIIDPPPAQRSLLDGNAG